MTWAFSLTIGAKEPSHPRLTYYFHDGGSVMIFICMEASLDGGCLGMTAVKERNLMSNLK